MPLPKLIEYGSLLKKPASADSTVLRMRSAPNVVCPRIVIATGM